ncbi:MAG: hypothetical protein JW819_06045 [Candidatus Krumholzibacteriota bacterium]|nr:hypothetical protein [Candidatus Krumholzibacteriota bacterium]
MSAPGFTPPCLAPIAQGATARIVASRDAAGRPAALKIALTERSNEALLREALAGRRFRHPALLAVIDDGVGEDGLAWLLLPLLSGETLAAWRGSDAELLDMLAPVADALDLLHHEGWGHGDLKPANLLLGRPPETEPLLLGDLGLIAPLGEVAPGGTPAYLSPSRLDGAPLSWRDDLHAFAAVAFEALAGRSPYGEAVGEDLMAAIRNARVEPLTRSRGDLATALDESFQRTLAGQEVAGSMMAWLDGLREEFGLPPAPRALFLDEDALAAGASGGLDRLEATREALARSLRSATRDAVGAGQEELARLHDWSGGSPRRLGAILRALLDAQRLREVDGWAVFAGPVAEVRTFLESTGALRPGDPAPPVLDGHSLDDWFRDAWQGGAGKAEYRLRLLGAALDAGQADWLAEVPHRELLALGDEASPESQARLLASHGTDESSAAAMGILAVLGLIRGNDLAGAARRFWEVEERLDLVTGDELGRRLTYQYIESGQVEEGLAFLRQWRDRKSALIAGRVEEIKLAAREAMAVAKWGSPEEAIQLAERHRKDLAGREGLWILDMALGNIAAEHFDYFHAAAYARSALEGVEREKGDENLRVQMLIFLGETLPLSGNADQAKEYLSEAYRRAAESGSPILVQRALSALAVAAIQGGVFAKAEEHLRSAIKSAKESGEWSRSSNLRVNLALAVFYQGEYKRLHAILEELRAWAREYDSFHDILYPRNVMAMILIDFGDLDEAEAMVEETLPIAEETGSDKVAGYLHLRRAAIHQHRDRPGEALKALDEAEARFIATRSEDEAARCRLLRVELAPDHEADGDRIAAAIALFERIGKPQFLPLAWRLEARRLRALGELDAAREALARGRAVAERIGSPEDLWRVHAEAAEIALAAGRRDEGRRQLVRAVDILRDLSLHFPAGPERDRFLARRDRRAALARLRSFSA